MNTHYAVHNLLIKSYFACYTPKIQNKKYVVFSKYYKDYNIYLICTTKYMCEHVYACYVMKMERKYFQTPINQFSSQ